jgi:transcriptional regulator with XRE-family HTH domain
MGATIPDAKEIGGLLREQRKKLGLTQKQCAERAKIAERQYQTFENGERSLMTCSFQIASRVVTALEWDVTGFFHGAFNHADNVQDEESISPANMLLKARREELGLKQRQVAEKAEITLQQYQKYEGGQRDLNRSSFCISCRVIEALEMDITSFYRGKIAPSKGEC